MNHTTRSASCIESVKENVKTYAESTGIRSQLFKGWIMVTRRKNHYPLDKHNQHLSPLLIEDTY